MMSLRRHEQRWLQPGDPAMGSRPRSCASDEGRESCKGGMIGGGRGLHSPACFVRKEIDFVDFVD